MNDTLEAKFESSGPMEFFDVYHRTLAEIALSRGIPKIRPPKQPSDEYFSVHQEENSRFQAACERVGIFSAATSSIHQAMWAHYCSGGCGVCFVLEWPWELLAKYRIMVTRVSYTDKARIHNRADDFREALIDVSKKNPEWSMAQVEEFSLTDNFLRQVGIMGISRAASVKHKDWEYEQEIRLITANSGPLPLMPLILKGVIFTRTDFPEWGSIMMLLHRLYPDAKLADLTFDHKEPFAKIRPLKTKMIPTPSD
ncbi:DUF2971 domain-containing protein [Ralstonia solanacearum]|uniref:DUF2971 domain-containing protein n=1 Tax=Ralstonia solanacearum TaxID=305 RepID=UPI001FF8D93E